MVGFTDEKIKGNTDEVVIIKTREKLASYMPFVESFTRLILRTWTQVIVRDSDTGVVRFIASRQSVEFYRERFKV